MTITGEEERGMVRLILRLFGPFGAMAAVAISSILTEHTEGEG